MQKHKHLVVANWNMNPISPEEAKRIIRATKKTAKELKKTQEQLEESKTVLGIRVQARTRELSELAGSLENKVEEIKNRPGGGGSVSNYLGSQKRGTFGVSLSSGYFLVGLGTAVLKSLVSASGSGRRRHSVSTP